MAAGRHLDRSSLVDQVEHSLPQLPHQEDGRSHRHRRLVIKPFALCSCMGLPAAVGVHDIGNLLEFDVICSMRVSGREKRTVCAKWRKIGV